MKAANFFAAAGLDRVGHRRKDPAWLNERLAHRTSRFLPVWRSQNLVVTLDGAGPRAALLAREALAALDDDATMLLGLNEETAYFAVDLSPCESPLEAIASEHPVEFADLRRVGPLLPRAEGSILAYAKGLAYWHSRHGFCGVCGHPTRSAEAGHVRRCTNPQCNTVHFPRTDPAVIMLVHDGDRCLLGRQRIWPKGMHSTLAGFVEPGESLEEAVAREIFEESGIVVDDVTYHSSQPWPFPSSLMLGFYARARTTEVKVDHVELEAASWYEREWLLTHQDDDDFRMPGKISIARRLIEDWLGR
jgi:NAD+ diphosphatase